MLNLVVCIKQVPMVSELPWDSKTGALKRELAEGMMNPACKCALEAALRIKETHGGHITAITMGPPMAEEVLYEALSLGADKGVLLTGASMAGADTLVTSRTLAAAVKTVRPDFDLILCGCQTIDSETGQVGPQLAEELDIPGASDIEKMTVKDNRLVVERLLDDFFEVLEMRLPGLVTVSTSGNAPRYASFAGIEDAFRTPEIVVMGTADIGLDKDSAGMKASPTRILDVYSTTSNKSNVVFKGAVKRMVADLFDAYGDKIGGAMGKDLQTHEHESS